MKLFLKILAAIVLILAFAITGTLAWASSAAKEKLDVVYEVPSKGFPIPFPAVEGNIAANDSAAWAQAIERGRHLVTARYACTECHGANLGGGVMVDAFPLGRLLGPNITRGKGSRVLDYTAKDWDRIVRHGVLPDGRAAVMPSEDFQKMSDQELSDIIAYIQSRPPVDNEVPPPAFGPLGKILLATGKLVPSAERIESHDRPHPKYPPAALADSTFGAHLAGTCTGCHGANLAGGPIVGGDPKWPPARNLTLHATGLEGWTYEDFRKAMLEGVRPDGTPLRMPMTLVQPYANNMTAVEMEALWVYLASLPPVENAIP